MVLAGRDEAAVLTQPTPPASNQKGFGGQDNLQRRSLSQREACSFPSAHRELVPGNQVLAPRGQLGQCGHEHSDDLRRTLGEGGGGPRLGDLKEQGLQGFEEVVDLLHGAAPVPGHRQVLADGPHLGGGQHFSPVTGPHVRCRLGRGSGCLTTDVSTCPPLRGPPTNSSSSFACSTTSGGCSLHRAGNWELSTLRERTRGLCLPHTDPSPAARPEESWAVAGSPRAPGGGKGSPGPARNLLPHQGRGWAGAGMSPHKLGLQQGGHTFWKAPWKRGLGGQGRVRTVAEKVPRLGWGRWQLGNRCREGQRARGQREPVQGWAMEPQEGRSPPGGTHLCTPASYPGTW